MLFSQHCEFQELLACLFLKPGSGPQLLGLTLPAVDLQLSRPLGLSLSFLLNHPLHPTVFPAQLLGLNQGPLVSL